MTHIPPDSRAWPRAGADDRPSASGEQFAHRHDEHDPHYRQLRSDHQRRLDEDYRAWRHERFSSDFETWRRSREALGETASRPSQPEQLFERS